MPKHGGRSNFTGRLLAAHILLESKMFIRTNMEGVLVFLLSWNGLLKFHRIIFVFVSLSIRCSPCQAVTGKIYLLKQHFLLPATAGSVTKNNKLFQKICKS